MTAKLPKIWYVATKDEQHVVRVTDAGIILSSAINDPTLYDHHTAKKISEELMGIMALSGIVVQLVIKAKQP